MSEKKLRIQILKKEEPIEQPKKKVKSIDPDELGNHIDESVQRIKTTRTKPITAVIQPDPTMIKLKLMGLQIVRKYKATKKRWQDPKYQTESDYLLCKEFEEMCQ